MSNLAKLRQDFGGIGKDKLSTNYVTETVGSLAYVNARPPHEYFR